MKKFITTVFVASIFFLGICALVENAGARFKSDEKALDLVREARAAIGGEAAITAVQGMIIKGQSTQTVKVNGATRSEQGESEIALQFPDKLMRSVKIGHADGNAAAKIVENRVDVIVERTTKDGNKVIGTAKGGGVGVGAEPGTRVVIKVIKKDDGTVQELKGAEAEKIIVRDGNGATSTWTSKDGKTFNVDGKHVVLERTGSPAAHHEAMRHNEMLRFTLSLLLTAPQGMDVDYTYAGEGDADGTPCNIVVASFGGQSFKLFLDRSSNLPVMMSFNAVRMPKVMHFEMERAPGADPKERTVMKKIDASKAMAEFTVRFADYRTVNGVQLPFKWTQTVGGETDEIFDVTSYEINPPNIGERFQHQNMKVKVRKPDGN